MTQAEPGNRLRFFLLDGCFGTLNFLSTPHKNANHPRVPSLPKMMTVRQRFPQSPPIDISEAVGRELQTLRPRLKSGARVAVAVGSRGIANLQSIVSHTISSLREAGVEPFVLPAMGSHGGATPEGQIELLGEYGITEDHLGVPILASMETRVVGSWAKGADVHFSAPGLEADGILVVNRVKPHTDFHGKLGSGILKMMVVGLGKRNGASAFHRAANRLGFEHVLRNSAKLILEKAPILGGLALVENQFHETARIQAILPERLEAEEERLFQESAKRMARLPWQDVDLLIVDRMGKNLSGSGMDPNVIGRSVHGYSSLLKDRLKDVPAIRRLFVRSLTPESHGNGTGLGMADFATTRLVESMDRRVTTINVLTAMTVQGGKVPIHFDTDREVIEHALETLALVEGERPRIMRILDTLNLEVLQVSEAYADELRGRDDLECLADWDEMTFDARGNLSDLPDARG